MIGLSGAAAGMLMAAVAHPGATHDAPPVPAAFDRVAWIAGHWVAEEGGVFMEEVWTSPVGDAMMGMFRVVQRDTVRMYELLAIEQDAGGLMLRLKHFDRGLVGREERAEVVTFALASAEEGRAEFATRPPDAPKRLVFTRQGADGLEVALEKSTGGRQTRQVFTYRRKR